MITGIVAAVVAPPAQYTAPLGPLENQEPLTAFGLAYEPRDPVSRATTERIRTCRLTDAIGNSPT